MKQTREQYLVARIELLTNQLAKAREKLAAAVRKNEPMSATPEVLAARREIAIARKPKPGDPTPPGAATTRVPEPPGSEYIPSLPNIDIAQGDDYED